SPVRGDGTNGSTPFLLALFPVLRRSERGIANCDGCAVRRPVLQVVGPVVDEVQCRLVEPFEGTSEILKDLLGRQSRSLLVRVRASFKRLVLSWCGPPQRLRRGCLVRKFDHFIA